MLKRLFGTAALVFLLALGFSAEAQAQNLKVGYANPDLLQFMPEYQGVYATLQQESQGDQDAYQALIEEFQEKLDRYQRQQPLLSEESRAERETELRNLQTNIQQAEAAANQKLQRREQQLLQPLLEKLNGAIEAEAQAQSLDLVLSAPAILYVNPDRIIDITEAVATRLGIPLDDAAASN